MLKRILAVIALAAVAAACNSGATAAPTLTLTSPSGLESGPASEMPIPTVTPS
jgi:ABC-type glycerol-3-phosphate transport system substrate-binding protein